MATLTRSVAPSNTLVADFRLWAQYVHDSFILGMVDTLATGSVDIATMAIPTAQNESKGFKVYRFDDALQATYPVFVKVEFGSGTSAGPPGLWFTIGKTHDGAGTLTNILQARTQIQWGAQVNTLSPCYSSGNTAQARVGIVLWSALSTTYSSYFFLERSKNAAGQDTGDGLILIWGKLNAWFSQYIIYANVVQPTLVYGITALLTYANPSTFGAAVGLSLAVPMGNDAKQPGKNVIVCRDSDFSYGSAIYVRVYGATRTFFRVGNFVTDFRNSGLTSIGDSSIRLFMLYE